VRRLAAMGVTLLLMAAPVGAAPPGGFRGGVLDPPRPAPDFTLPAHDGADFRIYTQAFDRTFVGLTGTPSQLAAVQKAYGVIVKKQVVKGTEGRLRLMLPFGTSIDTMTHDIGLLLGR